MKPLTILALIFVIVISGCIENPFKQVPVVKVNITLVEKDGIVFAEKTSFTQGMVDYAGRPKNPVSEFPVISGRTLVIRNNTNMSTEATGSWESLRYMGNGTYSFNIGFNKAYYPSPNDLVHISIVIANKKGERIGYVVHNMIWT